MKDEVAPLPSEICAELITASEDYVGGFFKSHPKKWYLWRRPVNSIGLFAFGAGHLLRTAGAYLVLTIVTLLVLFALKWVGWVSPVDH
jgi:hypothetical protein